MKATRTRKENATEASSWPRRVQPGRTIVTVYKRKTPVGNPAYMVANYVEDGKRRFDSYSDEAEALEAAETLAKRIDARDYVAASMTRDQALEYANAAARLKPFNVTVDAATATVAECLKAVGDLSNLQAAAKLYAVRHKRITPKRVCDVVTDLLAVKKARGASPRYLDDLRVRLGRFADAFVRDIGNVTTSEIQEWLDKLELGTQSYANFRRVLYLLFEFAVARGNAVDNPLEGVERVKVRNGDLEIFTPDEMSRLLAAASPDFLPALAIGAFAGLRSAEIERLEWQDIDLASRHLIIGASRAKTATRRVVPLHDNLLAWLTTYAQREGLVWKGTHDEYYDAQQETAAATEVEADPEKGTKVTKPVKWKSNALRHSYASYRFAQTGDAGRVAGELGNSAAVVHKHYRELVKPADAERWFNIRPEAPGNLLALPATSSTEAAAAQSLR